MPRVGRRRCARVEEVQDVGKVGVRNELVGNCNNESVGMRGLSSIRNERPLQPRKEVGFVSSAKIQWWWQIDRSQEQFKPWRRFSGTWSALCDKIICIPFQFSGEADQWFEEYRKTLYVEQFKNVSWEELKEDFIEKFILLGYHIRKETECQNLC